MTTQRSGKVTDLRVAIDPATTTWVPGRSQEGLDDRLEVAVLEPGDRVAVRDTANPAGPALVFSSAEWQGLLSGRPSLVDLRRS
ncbi:DUF397 domain-containing protein [Kineosporia sp. J2-2]|uniref:DUF397 domain-containing protein n=1 Tax=Kineosporia corallincola TaxID=2835133 RepID=A0ABS5THZ6_9ACTN|nr:DUF397 domain-containing protein [Kineosporia corallincola]MBT0770483.1 DUF397 domain-containing protein [Kineosporia corallincola]